MGSPRWRRQAGSAPAEAAAAHVASSRPCAASISTFFTSGLFCGLRGWRRRRLRVCVCVCVWWVGQRLGVKHGARGGSRGSPSGCASFRPGTRRVLPPRRTHLDEAPARVGALAQHPQQQALHI